MEPSKEHEEQLLEYEDPRKHFQYEQPISHRGILLMTNDEYFGTTINVVENKIFVIVTVTFITIPGWKSYVRIAFQFRSGNGCHPRTNNPMRVTEIQYACIYMSKECIQKMEIVPVDQNTKDIPKLEDEKRLGPKVELGVVHLLTIQYKSKALRHDGFAAALNGDRPLPQSATLLDFVQTASTLRLVLNAQPQIADALNDFRKELQETAIQYTKFYPKHPDKHFIQMGDYPKGDKRPAVWVPAALTLDSFSEYTTGYGFAAIAEQEVVDQKAAAISSARFQLRVMDIADSDNSHYLGFMKSEDLPNVRLEVDDRFKINFNLKNTVEETEWTAVVINPLPFASVSDICIILFRPWIENLPIDTDVKALPVDISDLRAAHTRVAEHPAHEVIVKYTPTSRTLKRQITSLQQIYDIKNQNPWRARLLGRDVNYTDVNVYSHCSDEAMTLLKPDKFNEAQNEGLEYLYKLPNGMGIVTGPAATGKTEFILTILQPFLHAKKDSAQPGVLICTPDNATADELACHIYNRAKLRADSREAIVIRMHNVTTETVALHNAHLITEQAPEISEKFEMMLMLWP